MIAAGTEHGGTLIYDLEPKEGTPAGLVPSVPAQDLPSSDRRASVHALEFNHKTYVHSLIYTKTVIVQWSIVFFSLFRPNILACGDSAGAVIIWKLAERFTTAQNDEIENLQILNKSCGDS